MKKHRNRIFNSILALLCAVFLLVGSSVTEESPVAQEAEPEQLDVSDQTVPSNVNDNNKESLFASDISQEVPTIVENETNTEIETSSTAQEKVPSASSAESTPPAPEPPQLSELEKPDTIVADPDQTPPENSTFSIRFLDVGQADSALVECDGYYALIDGGNKGDSSLLYSVLKQAEIKHLEYVWASHCHEDHLGGIPGALNYATADYVFCPTTAHDSDAFNDFEKYADQNGNGIVVPSVGDTYLLGSAEIKVLGINSASDTNNTSIVLKIQYGETSFLFTGDAEREAEQVILAAGADLFSTVLKVGHHGSSSSTTYPFLREIMPSYAVICVGKDNSYGHPTEDVLSRLRDADVKVYRTDLQGEILCTSNGKDVTFTVERNDDVDTLSPAVAIKPAPAPVVPTAPKPEPAPETAQKPQPEESAGTDYVLNTNTKKFHYPTCNSVNQMKDKNKAFFNGQRDEIIAMGYSACGNCHP